MDRAIHKNTSADRARFEVCNHKWTDLSEAGFGVALLNDGKYGLRADGTTLGLSLLKGGCRPDTRGDEGEHIFTYAILPHASGFSAESVIQPAYELNTGVLSGKASVLSADSFCRVDVPGVIVESIKRAEDGSGMVLRLYEAERRHRQTVLTFAGKPSWAAQTNMLEEEPQPCEIKGNSLCLDFRPFEIKTLLVKF